MHARGGVVTVGGDGAVLAAERPRRQIKQALSERLYNKVKDAQGRGKELKDAKFLSLRGLEVYRTLSSYCLVRT
jgi:hypothetical protein